MNRLEKSEKHKLIAIERALAGQSICGVPFGYKRNACGCPRGIKGAGTRKNCSCVDEVRVDPVAAEYIKQAFNMYATGQFSAQLICDVLEKSMGFKKGDGTVHAYFANKFYMGYQTIKEVDYPHNYPPIIEPELWHKVQDQLRSHGRTKTRYRGKFFLFRGLIKCGICNHLMTPEAHKKNNYYACAQFAKHGAGVAKREYISEKKIIDHIFSKATSVKVDFQALCSDHVKMRLFVSQCFDWIVVTGGQVTSKLLDEKSAGYFDEYIKLGRRPTGLDKEFEDILNFLHPHGDGIDRIARHLNLSLQEAMDKILDLQLKDLIKQDESGLWKLI